jgi:hypothetical protein
MPSKQDLLKLRVYNFYRRHIDFGKLFTVRHFQLEGVPKSTMYRLLDHFSNDLPSQRKVGSGRKAKIFTPAKIAILERSFCDNDQLSIRSAAGKFRSSKSLVHKVLKTKTTIRYRKKIISKANISFGPIRRVRIMRTLFWIIFVKKKSIL